MSIMDVLKGMTAFEIEGMFETLDESFDSHDQPTIHESLSKPVERRYDGHPRRHARVQ